MNRLLALEFKKTFAETVFSKNTISVFLTVICSCRAGAAYGASLSTSRNSESPRVQSLALILAMSTWTYMVCDSNDGMSIEVGKYNAMSASITQARGPEEHHVRWPGRTLVLRCFHKTQK